MSSSSSEISLQQKSTLFAIPQELSLLVDSEMYKKQAPKNTARLSVNQQIETQFKYSKHKLCCFTCRADNASYTSALLCFFS